MKARRDARRKHKAGHGGKRAGAGRKAVGGKPMVTRSQRWLVAEWASVERRAKAAGMTPSAWLRDLAWERDERGNKLCLLCGQSAKLHVAGFCLPGMSK